MKIRMSMVKKLVPELIEIYNKEQDSDVILFASEEIAMREWLTDDELDKLVELAYKAIGE